MSHPAARDVAPRGAASPVLAQSGAWRRSIVHVAAPAKVGGLERVLYALASGQARRGCRAQVIAVLDETPDRYPLVLDLRRAGVSVIPLRLDSRAYLEERRLIAAQLGVLQPSIVHTHGYRPDLIDAPVARRLGIATVTTLHGFLGWGLRGRLYEYLQIRACRKFDAVVAVSEPIRARVIRSGTPADRVHLIRNAWDGELVPLDRLNARMGLGVPESGARIGWVGRLSQEKGADTFLRALAALRDLEWTASILGDGPDRGSLEGLARSLGIGTRVLWHGVVPDAARLYRAFDVFVLSSRTEGTPITLFEAMAARVPIVATEVGGVPDVVSRREALLVPANDPAALARAIATVLQDPEGAIARTEAAEAALRTRFGVETWLDEHERLYSLLAPA